MRSILLTTSLACAIFSTSCVGVSRSAHPQVLVELNDGQRLVGALTTLNFSLETPVGILTFDAANAGEIGPAGAQDLQRAEQRISLWLRDGSEFVGQWQAPAVELLLAVGGEDVPVAVPMDKLQRLQFEGQPFNHPRPVFRVLTRNGDDLYVDAGESRVRLQTEVGEIRPFLSEIARLDIQDAAGSAWRVVLKNGTSLVATVSPKGLDLRPVMGPREMQLDGAMVARLEPASATPLPSGAAHDRYYDNVAQRAHKQAEASAWR